MKETVESLINTTAAFIMLLVNCKRNQGEEDAFFIV